MFHQLLVLCLVVTLLLLLSSLAFLHSMQMDFHHLQLISATHVIRVTHSMRQFEIPQANSIPFL